MKKEILENAKKIIIKIGSSTLTSKDGKVDIVFLNSLCEQVKELMDQGKKVIIVSSGARIAGVSSIDKWSRKEDINYKQALCAIGQVELMGAYRKIFLESGLHIAQILLTKDDFESEHRSLNIRNTLFTLIDEDVVPIINENDTVCVEEIKIGDNDMLAARTGVLWGADLVILLSDIDGVFDKNPKEHKDAKLIDFIDDIYKYEKNISVDGKSNFGTGGMKTKLQAAKLVNKYNCSLMITSGKHKTPIISALKGETKCTVISKL